MEPEFAPPQTSLPASREARPDARVNAIALGATVVVALAALLLLLALPTALPDAESALPVVYALATCGAALSAFLLLVRSRLHQHRHLAWISLGYTIAAAAMALQLLGFPGVFANGGPLGTSTSGAAALYLLWHLAISCCTLIGVLGVPHRRVWLLSVGGGFACALLYVSLGPSPLPDLVGPDGRYSILLEVLLLLLAGGALLTLFVWLRVLGPRPPWTDAWVGISLALGAWDILLHAFADQRFSAIWWGSLSMRSAQHLVLAVGLLATFAALHRALERHEEDMAERLNRSEAETRTRQHALAAAHLRIGAAMVGDALRMVFQPIADLTTGRVVGTEALARFSAEPRRGPDEWFAEAQSIGRGVELELNAIRRALTQLDEIPAGAYLGLNVSPALILSGALDGALTDLPGERLVLEITEHDPVEDYEELVRCLAPLRTSGVRLAIDDAGAGFASLRHITLLMPDMIKLDVSLTRDVHDDVVAQALVRSLASFAGHTGATIVAEGIETSEQLATLRRLGVRRGQGYLLGRPAELPLTPALSPTIVLAG